MCLAFLYDVSMDDRLAELELELQRLPTHLTQHANLCDAARIGTYLKELVRLPHPRRQALERNVHSWDRIAAKELRLVALEHGQRNAEQDVGSIKEQDVPHAEKRLQTDK